MVYYAEYPSPVGTLLLTASDGCLTGLWMGKVPLENAQWDPAYPVLREAKCWLEDYFRGEVRQAAFPLAPEGTAFQKQVWQILLTIPFGKTRTYGQIAREMAMRLGKEKMSAQAVGQAVGKNPISILIPCHRCIGAQGRLTGYAGGLENKAWLLRHEGVKVEENRIRS